MSTASLIGADVIDDGAGPANTNAVISACGTYRYRLQRRWHSSSRPPLCFVMLNPSTADATIDDPTIRKCVGFADRLGFGAIDVVNLFAYRATDPANLRAAGFPVGPHNDGWIEVAARNARSKGGAVVAAWGANARKLPRTSQVLALLKACEVAPQVLQRCSDGTPAHPLMLPYTCKLQPLDDA
jgi:hypothetical protein